MGSTEYEKVLEVIAFTISGFVQAENRTGLGIVFIIFRDRCAEDRQEMFCRPVFQHQHVSALKLRGGECGRAVCTSKHGLEGKSEETDQD